MALHPDFPDSLHVILDPERWFPAGETLRDNSMIRLIPPLVSCYDVLYGKIKGFVRD